MSSAESIPAPESPQPLITRATYSPDDNKIRLYPSARLPEDVYARAKAVRFSWAPKQELFFAHWSPAAEDLAIELAGEIQDEDKSLVERATERAQRFNGYGEKRGAEAEQAFDAANSRASGIPFGQPIMIGHHSAKRAQRDKEKIEQGMKRAVGLWETADYWKSRAAGAIAEAKYKEIPSVRARRIKKIESDLRSVERDCEKYLRYKRLWEAVSTPLESGEPAPVRDRVNYLASKQGLGYRAEVGGPLIPMTQAIEQGIVTPEQAAERALKSIDTAMENRTRWVQHFHSRLTYERAMLASAGGLLTDQIKPEIGGACQCWASRRGAWSYIRKVNRVTLTVHDNWGHGGKNFPRNIPLDKITSMLTRAQVEAARAAGTTQETDDGTGFYLLTEAPEKSPAPRPAATRNEKLERAQGVVETGVEIVSAPQLFPTPPDLAAQLVQYAGVQPGDRVLEPSAGTGNLIRAIQAVGKVDLVAVEINLKLAMALRSIVSSTHTADFLEMGIEHLGTFDRIVMNPPFANGDDIKHIEHAMRFLCKGGTIAAICANGPRQRDRLMPLAEAWIDLPDDSFKASGTSVSTAVFIFRN